MHAIGTVIILGSSHTVIIGVCLALSCFVILFTIKTAMVLVTRDPQAFQCLFSILILCYLLQQVPLLASLPKFCPGARNRHPCLPASLCDFSPSLPLLFRVGDAALALRSVCGSLLTHPAPHPVVSLMVTGTQALLLQPLLPASLSV